MSYLAFYNDTEELKLVIKNTNFVAIKFTPELFNLNDWRNYFMPNGCIKHQMEFVAGRICAKLAINKLTGLDLWLTKNNLGLPNFPSNLCGSISHSKNYAAALIGKNNNWHSLGVDIEQIMSFKRANLIKDKILTKAELQNLSIDTKRLVTYVTLIFSLKESIYKALYPLVLKSLSWHSVQIIFSGNLVRVELLDNSLIDFQHKITAYIQIIDNKVLTAISIDN